MTIQVFDEGDGRDARPPSVPVATIHQLGPPPINVHAELVEVPLPVGWLFARGTVNPEKKQASTMGRNS